MGLCLIYNIALVFSFEKIYPENMKINKMVAEVVTLKEKTNYYYKYEIKVNNFDLKFSKGTKNVLYTKNQNLFPGDIIVIDGEFEKAIKASNYKEFNYRNYLKQHKIYGIIYENNLNIVENRKDFSYFFGKIRNALLKQIEINYDNEYVGFLQGILVGFTNNLSNQSKENFRSAGISHILAISGMHVYIVIKFCNYLFKIFIRNKKIRNCILIIFLILFYFTTGMNNSCLRAVIMMSLQFIAFNLNRKSNFVSSLIFSFFIIILINIYNIFNTAVWLSFIGTVGIYFFLIYFLRF